MKLKTKPGGFTLTELLVTIAILGIIAAIAYPSYQNYVQGARRAEARNMLLDAANREERFFADSAPPTYTNDMAALGYTAPFDSQTGNYRLSAPVADATTYTLTATAQGAQLNDDNCDSLTLTSIGVKTSLPVGNQCWE